MSSVVRVWSVVVCLVVALASAVFGVEPRLAPVPESQWTEAQRAVVARYGRDGRATNALRVYLHHPVLAENILPFERYIASESTLEPRHRELLILRTAWLARSEYVWAQHADLARKAGINNDELTRIARGPDAPGWKPFESVLLRTVDELLVDSFVSDRTWAGLTAQFDTRQVMVRPRPVSCQRKRSTLPSPGGDGTSIFPSASMVLPPIVRCSVKPAPRDSIFASPA